MKVLTAAQMREVDRRTIELGIPGIVLMENAGQRVVEFLAETFAPLAGERIAILCGKATTAATACGGAPALHPHPPKACGWRWPPSRTNSRARRSRTSACSPPAAARRKRDRSEMRGASIVLDALLGTGCRGRLPGRCSNGSAR